jgi:xanthosine utilization system XapX-like protein
VNLWVLVVVRGASPPLLELLNLSGTTIGKNVIVGRVPVSSHEIAHMQLGQCGNQEADTEVFCHRCRAVRAIAARANLPQRRFSRLYLLFSAAHLPKQESFRALFSLP